jgi:predicted nucleic acid-binding protein
VCAELLDDVLLHHELVISEFIIKEVCRKLLEKFRFPKNESDEVAAYLRRAGILVVSADLPADLCRDQTNITVLGTAVSGECSLLISVDRDLLDMSGVTGIPIIRTGDYWRRATEVD